MGNFILSIFLTGLTCILFPAITFLIIFIRNKKLKYSWFRKRFGQFYEDIKTSKRIRKTYPFLFILRRIMVVVITMYMNHILGIQVMTIMYMNLFFFVFVGSTRPFKDKNFNKFNLFSESCILHMTYLMVIFTDFCSSATAKYNLGWFFILELLVFLVVSLCFIMSPMVTVIRNYSKWTYIRIKQKWKKCTEKAPVDKD